ncbi:hypothetical protein [Paenibacillus qinlingensis]|uniref:Transposase YbfD/YdcC n=1 Tax=Paenibacillus qinlingensis TaxID=1837343 RepID=A0ABU1NSI0_9BACL|nr:hypothetical protein [Paenibacillus qinlingensis]MDR6550026.1 putative transposase YbfD/YdcC [Paenibacillus qinlingensis]
MCSSRNRQSEEDQEMSQATKINGNLTREEYAKAQAEKKPKK